MKKYETDNPIFSEILDIFEPYDRGHADVFNVCVIELFENTIALKNALLDEESIEDAFFSAYPNAPDAPEQDSTALSSEDIEDATDTPWDGSSSDDTTALSSEDVEDATDTPWDGSSSDDTTALSKEDIEEVTTS